MNNRITICVITHNRAQELPRTLTSLFAQTYDNFEILVVDNGSHDETKALLESIKKPNFSYILYETNLGFHRNVIRAVKSAPTEWVAVFHSDDIYFKNIISSMAMHLLNPTVGAVFSKMILISESTIQFLDFNNLISTHDSNINVYDYTSFIAKALRTGVVLSCPTFMTKKSVVIEVLDENKSHYSSDLDLWIPIVEKYKIVEVDNALMFYVQSDKQLSHIIHYKRYTPSPQFLTLDKEVRNNSLVKIVKKDSIKYYQRRFIDGLLILFNSITQKKTRSIGISIIYILQSISSLVLKSLQFNNKSY